MKDTSPGEKILDNVEQKVQPCKYRTVPSNYRPISLTSVIIKVFERVIRKQIVTFLISNGHLNPTQHGFRGGHSCLSALLSVFDDVMQLLISGNNTVDMVYLDFAKAFDKVYSFIKLKLLVLQEIGCLALVYHFLTGRTQFVRLQGGVSFDSPVISGVPQGTVLGPLLFIILMCDINSGITASSMVSFADDTRREILVSKTRVGVGFKLSSGCETNMLYVPTQIISKLKQDMKVWKL